MSTRCYDSDLNDAAWAWIAPYLPAARSGGRVGGHARPTCAPSLTRSFTCCEPVASGACYPASSRARAPFTITFVPGDAGVLAELQRALHGQARLSRGRFPCLNKFAPEPSCYPFALFDCSMAAATTASTVKPNFFTSFCRGADSPKVLMPTRPPSIPTYRSQPNLAACSTETRALMCDGSTDSRYASSWSSNSFH